MPVQRHVWQAPSWTDRPPAPPVGAADAEAAGASVRRPDLHVHRGFDRNVGMPPVKLPLIGIACSGVARDGDADQPVRSDDAVGRVELHPTRAGQVDLHPGMRIGRAAPARGRVDRGSQR